MGTVVGVVGVVGIAAVEAAHHIAGTKGVVQEEARTPACQGMHGVPEGETMYHSLLRNLGVDRRSLVHKMGHNPSDWVPGNGTAEVVDLEVADKTLAADPEAARTT